MRIFLILFDQLLGAIQSISIRANFQNNLKNIPLGILQQKGNAFHLFSILYTRFLLLKQLIF